jgi:Na+/proline symporter
VYTIAGGVQAVTWTDVKQMVVIVGGLFGAVAILLWGLPDDVGVVGALKVAGAAGRLNSVDFRFDVTQTYTFWSGLLGGLFLMLSYFGCDQSQVQRYLTARSEDEGRHSLLMSAFFKIPLQAVVLLTGVLVFVFYLFNPPPMLFNSKHRDTIERSSRVGEFRSLEAEFNRAFERRRSASTAFAQSSGSTDGTSRAEFLAADAEVKGIRSRAASLVYDITGDATYNSRTGDTPAADVNYVFPWFVTTRLPIGVVGLVIAAIFAAAMSSIAAELNSLATATVIDVYKRLLRPAESESHYLLVSKVSTGCWGLFACGVAVFSAGQGSLIEVVNRYGSFFYGSLLGVFVLALGFRTVNGHGAFAGLIGGMAAVAVFAAHPATSSWSFLWHNPVGLIAVLVVGLFVSALTGGRRRAVA